MNLIKEIRARIEARKRNTAAAGDYDEYADGILVGLSYALGIIDEVEKEHPVPSGVQEDKAATDYYLGLTNSSYGEGGYLLPRSINDAFKAGAEWQRNKPVPEDVQEAAKAYEDSLDYHECMSQWPSVGFASGMLAERERLMKEAVEVNVSNVGILQMGSILTDKGIFAGDTIQAIIIKKEK